MKSTETMTVAELSALLPAMLPRLWAFALRISGDQHDAEDLVQRACVRALERAHQLEPGAAPLSWMFSIVHPRGSTNCGPAKCATVRVWNGTMVSWKPFPIPPRGHRKNRP